MERLAVPNLTDHQDVGVLSQHAAEPIRKRQTDLRVDLDLRHARQLVFHRVFEGDDVLADTIDAVQRRVERGRLAGAGRPGDQYHAIRTPDQLLDVREGVGAESQ